MIILYNYTTDQVNLNSVYYAKISELYIALRNLRTNWLTEESKEKMLTKDIIIVKYILDKSGIYNEDPIVNNKYLLAISLADMLMMNRIHKKWILSA